MEAQARLAEIYVDSGRSSDALPFLRQAAEAGHVFSAAQLGAWYIIGHLVEKDLSKGFQLVERAANGGDAISQTFLATLWAAGIGTGRDFSQAVGWLVQAAKQGHARALRQLGCSVPASQETMSLRRSLLGLAANQGDDVAQYFLGKSLYRAGDSSAQRVAVDWCSRAARAGNPAARLFLSRNHRPPSDRPPPRTPASDIDWSMVTKAVRLPSRAGPLSEIVLRERPRISAFRGFLDDDLCDYMMSAAGPYLRPATVNDAERGMEVLDETRTNSIMGFYPIENDVITECIYWRISETVGFPIENGEVLGVLRYLPGQRYDPHNDFFDPDYPMHAKEIATGGQRVKTLLVYLNEDFKAGQTLFNKLDWTFRGKRGDALLFNNVDADGNVDRQTLHTGLGPTSGEKWIISLWIRDRAQR